ncbi:MAG: tetratricopeptide repeat protein [Rhodocyclaceae bacterium]|nr:tetratricopeptide repeat protein [Rhodocyclaceae bacterium]MCL4759328.1 tetratricopeptide repeat protein [Rhodocyclaceae bacterium]
MIFKVFGFAAPLCAFLALTAAPLSHAGDPNAGIAQEDPPAVVQEPGLPVQELTPEMLYLMLIGEIAGARGELAIGVEAYLKLAGLTRDPRVARRATEIALFAHDIPSATRAATIWNETDPSSDEARRVLASVLASSGDRLNEVQLHLARILAESPEQLRQNLLGLNRALARVPDKQMIHAIVFRLTEPYLDEPAAHFARAQAEAALEEGGVAALAAIEDALELDPAWEPAILFKTQLLVQLDATEQALAYLRTLLAARPDQRNLRMTYARTLVSARHFEAARDEFRTLLAASPDDRDLMYAVALMSTQLDDYETARTLFERVLDAGHPEADGIRLNLGQIAERRKQPDDAMRWYRTVAPGSHFIDAQIRIATLLANSGELEPARAHLRALEVDDADRRRLLFAETMLLRDAGRIEDALTLLDAALLEEPDDGQLLYESAMLAERLDRLNVMEARLRKLIALEPDHAHAYNALGYSLADRGQRLEEAEELIAHALELTPDDPFILDSMGWVRYRRSDPAGALAHLERAYQLRPDPEIAAHLGEVLWVLDRREEAERVWVEALSSHPENETLQRTVQRMRER